MGEMADQQIQDGMDTPCDWCGAQWPNDCDADCERRTEEAKALKKKAIPKQTRSQPMQLVKGCRYKVKAPGAKGSGVYLGRFWNREIKQWIYCFHVELSRYFGVEKRHIVGLLDE